MFSKDFFSIHTIEKSDLGFLRNLRNKESTWKNLGDTHLVNSNDQNQFFSSLTRNNNKRYFLLKRKDVSVGVIRITELDHLNKNACIGLDIAEEFRGRGYGREGYGLLLDYCFNILNLHRVWLLVVSFNHSAIRLYKSLGFIEEGMQRDAILRDGKYNDYLMMSLLEKEYRA